MSNKARKFTRPIAQRAYRKRFIIAVEGQKTEPQYFSIIRFYAQNCVILCLKINNRSAPIQVLKQMKDRLKKERLKDKDHDEAWLVVDSDEWEEAQLKPLFEWSQLKPNYGFALSSPNFEYWLLLHFEDGNNIANKADCLRRLKEYIPGYNKEVNAQKITLSRIQDAISRASRRDNPPCADWPRTLGQTTVYRLVERLISETN